MIVWILVVHWYAGSALAIPGFVSYAECNTAYAVMQRRWTVRENGFNGVCIQQSK
jgi:hypothetical protein